MGSALTKAFLYWKRGLPLPLDLTTELLVLGYDVGVLEDKYRR